MPRENLHLVFEIIEAVLLTTVEKSINNKDVARKELDAASKVTKWLDTTAEENCRRTAEIESKSTKWQAAVRQCTRAISELQDWVRLRQQEQRQHN